MAGEAKYTVLLSTRPSRRRCIIISLIGIIVLFIIILAIVLAVKASQGDDNKQKPTQKPETRFQASKFSKAAVAADAELCSMAGTNIMREGGNAADSAIASLFCLGVVNLMSCGIGGGGFMVLYKRKERKFMIYDYREVAPSSANESMFTGGASSVIGGLAIGVPGQVKGLWTVHQNHGKLNWSSLVEPAIKLAEEGFIVTKPVARAIRRKMNSNIPENLRELLTNDKGEMLTEGDLLKNPKLAATLRNIQEHNATDFYEGELAEKIFEDVQNASGIIKLQDLKDYKVKERQVLTLNLPGDLTLNTMNAPGGGPVVAMILNIMTGYDLSKVDLTKTSDLVDYYQKLIESMKFSYAQRGLLADPDFYVNKDELTEVLNLMTSKIVADKIRENKIWLNKTHDPSYYGGYWGKDDFGTSHLSVLAENGDAVSATATINYGFGSLVRSPVTGIIYNNEMDDFSTPNVTNLYGYPPSKANYIRPGKRPLSSMSPSIVTDKNGNVRMVAGASGGSRIISGTAQVILKKLFLGMKLGNAVGTYRLHHQGIPNKLFYLNNDQILPPKELLNELKKRRHMIVPTLSHCNVQAIFNDESNLHAMSDPRKSSKADGY